MCCDFMLDFKKHVSSDHNRWKNNGIMCLSSQRPYSSRQDNQICTASHSIPLNQLDFAEIVSLNDDLFCKKKEERPQQKHFAAIYREKHATNQTEQIHRCFIGLLVDYTQDNLECLTTSCVCVRADDLEWSYHMLNSRFFPGSRNNTHRLYK